MLINKFTKQKNGQYKIELDNEESIIVHEDLILKYDLLINKKIDDKKMEKLLEENITFIAYDQAIKYISTKMRSIKEVSEYLLKYEVHKDIINNTIRILVERGYLNDNSYAKSLINDRIHLSSDGPYKIARELEKKGVDESIIQDNLILFNESLQIEKINKIINKLKSTNRNKSSIMLKNKIINYLSNLGYEKCLIVSLVEKEKIISDIDIAKKEYDKLYKKLSRKYQGNELEYKIKEKMYRQGFSNYNSDI